MSKLNGYSLRCDGNYDQCFNHNPCSRALLQFAELLIKRRSEFPLHKLSKRLAYNTTLMRKEEVLAFMA